MLISRDSGCVVVCPEHITAKVTCIYNTNTSYYYHYFNSSSACPPWLPWGCLCVLVAPGDSAWTGFIDQQPRVTHASAIFNLRVTACSYLKLFIPPLDVTTQKNRTLYRGWLWPGTLTSDWLFYWPITVRVTRTRAGNISREYQDQAISEFMIKSFF